MSLSDGAERRRDALAIVLLAAAVIAVFAPVWLRGRYLGSDGQLAAFFEPIAVWSDHWIGGWPALADPVNYALYPIRLALRPFGSFTAFTIAAYVIAAAGAYGYLRVLGLSIAAAFVGGFSVPFSGFLLGHVEQTTMAHTAAWIAPALAGLEATLQRPRPVPILVCALSVACMCLAGHAQILLYGAALLGLYLLWRLPWVLRRAGGSAWLMGVAAVVVGILLAAPMLVLGSAYLPETPRKAMTYQRFVNSAAVPLRQLPTFFLPFLFGGGAAPYQSVHFGRWNFGGVATHVPFVVFLLAAPGVVKGPMGLGVFWAAIAVVGGLLLVGDGIPGLAAIMHALPLAGLFRAQGRHALELDLALAVLAGFGCEALWRGPRPRTWLPPVLVAVGVFAAAFAWVHGAYATSIARRVSVTVVVAPWETNPAVWIPLGLAVLGLAAVVVAAGRGHRAVKVGAVLAVLVVQTLAFAWFLPALRDAPRRADFAPTVMERVVIEAMRDEPGRLLNVRGEFGAVLTPERSRRFGLPALSWYGPLIPQRAAELLKIKPTGDLEASIADPANRVLDIYGVRYVVIDSETDQFHWAFDETDRWRLLARGSGATVRENLHARPLAWLVGRWQRTEDSDARATLRGAPDEPPQVDVVTTALTADLDSETVDGFVGGEVRARWTGDGALDVETDSPSGGLLVIGVNAVPGWSATVDDGPAEVRRADYALLAVRVPGGRHVVRLRYRPPGWRAAMTLAVAATVAMLAVVWLPRFTRRTHPLA